ncbi:MAG: phosphoglycerate mutase [Rudaea sp.]
MAQLTLLLPKLANAGGWTASSGLNGWLTRGDRLADANPGRDAVLRNCFEFVAPQLPSAALTRNLHGGDASHANWLYADLSQVAVDAVAVRLMACATLDVNADESEELARALRPLFGDAGFPLETSGSRWYLRCPAETRLPRFDAPEEVLGDDLMRHLPTGDNQQQWRHLLNEAQVILHNHPVNARRQQRGQVPANSVWFWGAGVLPDWVRTRFSRVASEDDVVLALAKMAGISFQYLAGFDLSDLKGDASIMLDLAAIREIEALAHNWLIPIDAAIKRRTISLVHVDFGSGERVVVKPWHRWRFWRRVRL